MILSLGSVCRIYTCLLYHNMAARWQPGDDQEDWATQRRAWGRHIKLWLTARIECWWWEDNVKRFIVGLLMKWLHPPMALDCNVHSDAGKDWGSAHIQIPDPGRVLYRETYVA